ncbi:MAG: hypothetical protein ACTHXG_14475 [Micrococcaceae bacterium]
MPRRNGVLYGVTEPRIFTPPLRKLIRKTTHGFEAIEFAENVLGWTLHPWQKWFLTHALELMPDGAPRFKTILLMVARQNGKTTIVQILTLWKMYVQGATLTLGTAQKEDSAKEIWREALTIVQDNPLLDAELGRVSTTNGSIQFSLNTGERYKVGAANRKGGRGLSIDGFAVIDELREQTSWDAWGALSKTTAAKRTGQVIAMSNAGDEGSVVLRTLRKNNIEAIESGTAKRVGHFEYSAPEECDMWDRDAWAMANPSVGYGEMTEETIEASAESDPEDVFRIEVLCQWWARTNASVFPPESWEARLDIHSEISAESPLIMSVTAWQDPESQRGSNGHASIAVAGVRPDGDDHVEVIAARDGLDWAFDKTVELYVGNDADGLVVQSKGSIPSGWIDGFRQKGLNVIELAGTEIANAHVGFFNAIKADDEKAPSRVWHIGQENLTFAAAEAQIKPLGGMWVFDMKNPVADVDPLVAAVQAWWGVRFTRTREEKRRSAYESSGLVVI